MSWYPESYTNVAMTNMHMRPNVDTGYPGRTYRFYNRGDTLYQFGEGLSYTSFFHSIIAAPSHISLHASPNTKPITNSFGKTFFSPFCSCFFLGAGAGGALGN